MFTARRRVNVAIAILLTIGGAVSLSACSVNPLEAIVEKASGGAIDVGGKSIPDGFPSEVPVIAGDVIFGISVADGENRSFNVTIAAGAESPLDFIETQFTDAGYESQAQASGSEGAGTVIFSNDLWNAVVVVAQSDDGYTANYTVTPIGE
ncbi:hypothetical protein [Salinibacterium sp. M195]|uniref:hypothetical protein n=1 Tax=Salinibacterium sp. M195 TaxID=2583374 RepID=UPI001C62EDC4|nr:hypothetical protein [Salinibacterium sp. M195]QYH36779.1 hypothetical protein FFT87_12990 [Salinibacterium sp. M195]